MKRHKNMLLIWISITFLVLWLVISLIITSFERAEGGEDLASESMEEAIKRGVIIADVVVPKPCVFLGTEYELTLDSGWIEERQGPRFVLFIPFAKNIKVYGPTGVYDMVIPIRSYNMEKVKDADGRLHLGCSVDLDTRKVGVGAGILIDGKRSSFGVGGRNDAYFWQNDGGKLHIYYNSTSGPLRMEESTVLQFAWYTRRCWINRLHVKQKR